MHAYILETSNMSRLQRNPRESHQKLEKYQTSNIKRQTSRVQASDPLSSIWRSKIPILMLSSARDFISECCIARSPSYVCNLVHHRCTTGTGGLLLCSITRAVTLTWRCGSSWLTTPTQDIQYMASSRAGGWKSKK